MGMQVSINQGACICAGTCVLQAPDVFDQDEDGVVLLLMIDVPNSLSEGTRIAAQLCPARAIVVS
jgi:ferredoxin